MVIENFEHKVKAKLSEVYLRRGQLISVLFFVVSVVVFFTYFNSSELKNKIQIASVLLGIMSIARLALSECYFRGWCSKKRSFNTYVTIALTNGIIWGIIIGQVAYDGRFTGHAFSMALFLMIGFSAGSVTSLGYVPWLFYSFNATIVLPIVISAGRLFFETSDSIFQQYLIYLSLYYAFINLQGYKITKDTRKMVEDELRLIDSVSDLKSTTEQLTVETLRTQHASRLSSLGEMAGGIAHEINNPLSIIVGHVFQVDRILRSEEKDLPEALTKLNKVNEAVERIAKTVKGLRHFSKQSDSDPMQIVELSKIISDTLDFCSEKMRVNGIELIVNQEPGITITCRPVQISQVLINLINNAYDAIHKTAEAKWIRIDARRVGSEIWMSVSNSGGKIPLEVQAKLFQPFFSTKEVGKGTGLGLSISKGILNQHGGDIWLDTSEHYTCFKMKIPDETQKSNLRVS